MFSIKVIVIICLILITIYYLVGNVTLMKNENESKNIKTPQNIGPISSGSFGDNYEIIADLEKYGQHLIGLSDKECHSAKEQIMKHVTFKREAESKNNVLSGITKKFAEFSNTLPSTPVLEHFEDYAPTNISMNVPIDKGTIHLNKCKSNVPEPMNDYDTQHLSKFESVRTAPMNGKIGKDDLSYFFDTHTQDQEFESTTKNNVMCPDEWEKHTKKCDLLV